jgi:hypothetical protein
MTVNLQPRHVHSERLKARNAFVGREIVDHNYLESAGSLELVAFCVSSVSSVCALEARSLVRA